MIDVTCAVLLRGGLVLVAQRADEGCWELPGGKVEPGEGLRACLARELAEELDVRVEVLACLGRADDPVKGIRLHCFVCRLLGGEPRALEHRELRWVEPAEMAALDLCRADRDLAVLLAGLSPGEMASLT